VIINALSRYYEILKSDERCNISVDGYGVEKIIAELIISKSGELIDVMPLKDVQGKKSFPKRLIVPYHKGRSGKYPPAYFMCDNSKYALGIDKDKGNYEFQFNNFKEYHNIILKNSNDIVSKAVLAFVNNWDIEKAMSNAIINKNFDTVTDDGCLIFRLEGETGYLHNNKEIQKLWREYNSEEVGNQIGQCMVTGENVCIAKLHTGIKNVKNAQSSGAPLVSFNDNVYESYNKENGYIAPVGKKTVFAYTTVLNYMLASQKQKIQIGDATMVFWAESSEEIYTDLAAELFGISSIKDGKESKPDTRIEALVGDVLYKTKNGIKMNVFDEKIDERTKFYILGLSPNAGRISVRFFHESSFGGFVEKISQHYKDMEIIKTKKIEIESNNITIKKIIEETISPKSSSKDVNPLMSGSLMRAIISGGMYPAIVYNLIMSRVKKDTDEREKGFYSVNYNRVSMIKAYLMRKARITKNKKLEEVLTVELNEQSTNNEYLLGRLFAVLEKAQQDSRNDTMQDSKNSTIRSKYFASAMTTPKTVFPILLRLAQHHIAKAEFGFLNDKRIESIVNGISDFPAHLTLDKQGVFILGYYQQRVKLWEKQPKQIENLKEEE